VRPLLGEGRWRPGRCRTQVEHPLAAHRSEQPQFGLGGRIRPVSGSRTWFVVFPQIGLLTVPPDAHEREYCP